MPCPLVERRDTLFQGRLVWVCSHVRTVEHCNQKTSTHSDGRTRRLRSLSSTNQLTVCGPLIMRCGTRASYS
eukprot:4702046-Amphidinium_carterae.2